jgi:hypothetical protein
MTPHHPLHDPAVPQGDTVTPDHLPDDASRATDCGNVNVAQSREVDNPNQPATQPQDVQPAPLQPTHDPNNCNQPRCSTHPQWR